MNRLNNYRFDERGGEVAVGRLDFVEYVSDSPLFFPE